MRKPITYGILGTACLMLAGCTAALAEVEEQVGSAVVVEDTLANGYYLSNNDDSYIHIIDGQIELCNYDYIADFTESWNEIQNADKADLEEYIANSAEIFVPQCELQDYTLVKFVGMGDEGSDFMLLTLNYEFASSVGTYTGYQLNGDGTISKVDNIYTYYGTELPESEDNV